MHRWIIEMSQTVTVSYFFLQLIHQFKSEEFASFTQVGLVFIRVGARAGAAANLMRFRNTVKSAIAACSIDIT
jgi:hypothetical protein